jgi:hypothetical protein
MYLFSRKTLYSPLWRWSRESPLYDTMAQEFEALWQANDPTQG